MYYYKVVIAYKGSHYFGWQSQPKESVQTIQQTIHDALKKMVDYQECFIIGAGRTDSGVHATGQVGKIIIPSEIAPAHLARGLNSVLPKDIRIFSCDFCSSNFHPSKDAYSKTYHYYFSIDSFENPLLNETVLYLTKEIDLEKMAKASQLFVGLHDFYNFTRRSGHALCFERTIYECSVGPGDGLFSGKNIYCLKIRGNGFLKQMVRYIAGALFKVAEGNSDISELQKFLSNRYDVKFSKKAAAKGLHLIEVHYEKDC